MKNTTFVSAGAGGGKTYRLTQDIARMIKEGMCRSEEIILTTFTETAARELREKVRSTLYASGLYEAAMNIDNAAIGTIHSVAYQFVSRYWYLLGISANVTIMADENSSFYISQSLSSLPKEEDLVLFENVFKAFNITRYNAANGKYEPNPDYWKDELKGIIDKTVELCIPEDDLKKNKDESKKLLSDVIKWNNSDITLEDVNKTVEILRSIFEAQVEKARDKDKKRKELNDSIRDIVGYCEGKTELPICQLYKVVGSYVNPPKYIQSDFSGEVSFLKSLAEKIPASKQVRVLIENYIDTIFGLAIEWKKYYEEFKCERCLLDFGDILQKFDELLGKEEVVDDIKSRYKIALVDEFQDCSPLQVRTFSRLSELMKHSIWVGDIKQAIYGFRGTNTELIKSIIDSFPNEKGKVDENGNMLDSLEHCWRSNETIVNLVNKVFVKVFDRQIEEDLVKLSIPERKETDPEAPKEKDILHWHFEGNNKDVRNESFIGELKRFVDEGEYSYKDIAILYRNNSDVKNFIEVLKNRKIPYNIKLDINGKDSPDDISTFLNAVLSFAARSSNELSKAIIVNRIEDGFDVSKILSDRLKYLDEDSKERWLSDSDVVNRLLSIRETIGNQSVNAAVETIVTELNLNDLIKRIDPDAPSYNFCSALIAKASAYESICMTMGMSSTLLGFTRYLKENPVVFPGDDNGITVMTYHKSKGLEWPCVMLCSLEHKPLDGEKSYFGTLTLKTEKETLLRLVPIALKSVLKPNLLETNEFFIKLGNSNIEEAQRLMYVGMTRPKEQLVLVTNGKDNKAATTWLQNIGCDTIDANSEKWYDSNITHKNVLPTDMSDEVSDEIDKEFKILKNAERHGHYDELFISPSKVKPLGNLYEVKQLGKFADSLQISSVDKKDSTIGNFIHHAMCLWNGDREEIESLSNKYDVKVKIDDLATSIDNFWKWMKENYGEPIAVERELPFCFTNDKGQIVNGEIDLVYRTDDGDILVDYKTYQGSEANLTDKDNTFFAGKYSGQIALYEDALKRHGRNVIKRLICYLSLGVIVSFE